MGRMSIGTGRGPFTEMERSFLEMEALSGRGIPRNHPGIPRSARIMRGGLCASTGHRSRCPFGTRIMGRSESKVIRTIGSSRERCELEISSTPLIS